jgi:hypothetical protein
LTGELHKIHLTEISHTKQDRRGVIKSRMKVLSGRISHIVFKATAACSVFDTASWWIGSELRCFGDLEEKAITSHFHCCVVNHSPEKHSASGMKPRHCARE